MRPQPPKPRIDSIVGGLTRPPMMLGIPFTLFVPIHGVAYALTVRDNRFVDVIITRFSKCPVTRNHRFWGGDSYKP